MKISSGASVERGSRFFVRVQKRLLRVDGLQKEVCLLCQNGVSIKDCSSFCSIMVTRSLKRSCVTRQQTVMECFSEKGRRAYFSCIVECLLGESLCERRSATGTMHTASIGLEML